MHSKNCVDMNHAQVFGISRTFLVHNTFILKSLHYCGHVNRHNLSSIIFLHPGHPIMIVTTFKDFLNV